MIFTPHILVGAVIGAKTHNLGLVIIFSLLSHFIMDWLPHWDYPVSKNLRTFQKTKKIKHFFPPLIKASVDFLIALLIILIIVWQKDLSSILIFIILGAFFSLLPDVVNAIVLIFAKENFTKNYFAFQYKYLHYPESKIKEGKITFLGLTTEILVIIISCVVLLNL